MRRVRHHGKAHCVAYSGGDRSPCGSLRQSSYRRRCGAARRAGPRGAGVWVWRRTRELGKGFSRPRRRQMNAVESAVIDVVQAVIPIEGMTCAACARRVEKALRTLPGVDVAVNLASEQAEGRYSPALVDSTDLEDAVGRAGCHLRGEACALAAPGLTRAACAGR